MSNPDERPLVRAIRDHMVRQGLTQAMFAKLANVSQSSISRLLSGKTTSLHLATEHRIESFLAGVNSGDETLLREPIGSAPAVIASAAPGVVSNTAEAIDRASQEWVDDVITESRGQPWTVRRKLAHRIRHAIDRPELSLAAQTQATTHLLDLASKPSSDATTQLLAVLTLAKSHRVKSSPGNEVAAGLINIACDRELAQHPQVGWTIAKDASPQQAAALLERYSELSDWTRARLLLTVQNLRHHSELQAFAPNHTNLGRALAQCQIEDRYMFDLLRLWETLGRGKSFSPDLVVHSDTLDSVGLTREEWGMVQHNLARFSRNDPSSPMAPTFDTVGLIARGALSPAGLRLLLDLLAFEIDLSETSEQLGRGRYDRFARLVTPTLLAATQYDVDGAVFAELARCREEGLRWALAQSLGVEPSNRRFWQRASVLSRDDNEWVVRDTLKAVAARLSAEAQGQISEADRVQARAILDNAIRWSLNASRRGGGYEVEVVAALMDVTRALSHD